MSNIIIKHSNGSKAGLQETLSLDPGAILTIGRGRGNDICFDPEKEDMVSRSHCRIIRDKDHPDKYAIEDSGSVNGTYVNNMPINGKTLLSIGDIITVGKNGPKIEFDLNPRPESALKKTRLADSFDEKKTTVHKAVPESKETIGKQTMQHIIRQSEKKNKMSLLIVSLAILLLASTGGYLLYKKKNVKEVREIVKIENQKTGLTPAEIAKANQDKVVYVEFAWKLTEIATGEELYQVYMPVKGNAQVRYTGLYITDEKTQKTVPYLTTRSNIPKGAIGDLIGSAGTGSGFVVDERGFIATNRHVAANWFTSFQFQSYAFPGILVQKNAQGRFELTNKVVNAQDVGEWVPGNNPAYKGVNSYLDVTFANNAQRTPANTVRVSTTHDVAMVKIDLPESLPAVQLYDSYNEIQPGDAAVVVGYPGLAPQQYVLKRSQDRFNTNPNISTVPVPTISNGNVGRLVKGSEKSDKIDEYKSGWGDYYQLTINSTGAGNSGGPMFDEKGRAVGIFSANTYGNGTAITFAVPIKYAIELMGRQKVIE